MTTRGRPQRQNLVTVAGDDFELVATFEFDLTGFTQWKAQIRPYSGAPDATAVDVDIDTSQQASRIITFRLGHEDTATLADGSVWDAQVLDASARLTTFLTGSVQITPQVTT